MAMWYGHCIWVGGWIVYEVQSNVYTWSSLCQVRVSTIVGIVFNMLLEIIVVSLHEKKKIKQGLGHESQ